MECANKLEGAADYLGHATPLTGRERKVLQLLAESNSNKEVAMALGISIRTAETYRARIMNKLIFIRWYIWCAMRFATELFKREQSTCFGCLHNLDSPKAKFPLNESRRRSLPLK